VNERADDQADEEHLDDVRAVAAPSFATEIAIDQVLSGHDEETGCRIDVTRVARIDGRPMRIEAGKIARLVSIETRGMRSLYCIRSSHRHEERLTRPTANAYVATQPVGVTSVTALAVLPVAFNRGKRSVFTWLRSRATDKERPRAFFPQQGCAPPTIRHRVR
jgi:hypothetical protein